MKNNVLRQICAVQYKTTISMRRTCYLDLAYKVFFAIKID